MKKLVFILALLIVTGMIISCVERADLTAVNNAPEEENESETSFTTEEAETGLPENTESDTFYVEDSAESTEEIESNETYRVLTPEEIKEFNDGVKEYRESKDEVLRERLYQILKTAKTGINWDYVKARNGEGYLYYNRVSDYLGISDRFPKMDLKKVCEIINSSKSFEEITEKFSEADHLPLGTGYPRIEY